MVTNGVASDYTFDEKKLGYAVLADDSKLFVKPTEEFELDWDKVKTLEDLKLIVKNWMNPNELATITINNGCKDYEKMKHLAKEK